MALDGPTRYATEVVRVFPDYAGTVIWFLGPVDYPETGLSEELVGRLVDWEAAYYAALTENQEWRSLEALHRFSADGLELARAVSREIGPELVVEYRSFENPKAVAELRSDEPASNPAARDAFAALGEQARAEWEATQARVAAAPPGASGVWLARHRSGAIFRPDP